MIVVKQDEQSHARAIYSCELANAELHDGPWMLTLISEKSQCGFVFPGQVQIDAGCMSAGECEPDCLNRR